MTAAQSHADHLVPASTMCLNKHVPGLPVGTAPGDHSGGRFHAYWEHDWERWHCSSNYLLRRLNPPPVADQDGPEPVSARAPSGQCRALLRLPVVRHCCCQALAKAMSDAGVGWAAERENQGDRRCGMNGSYGLA